MPENPNSITAHPRAVGLLGGGVIGGGWAARFILNGVDVRLYDPASNAVEYVQKILANARRAYRRLTDVPLPAEGALTLVDSVEDAVRDVDLVQESAPERVELKQKLLAAASRAAGPSALICSSTSGFRPSLLQAEMDYPECFLVAHPFQPVYMLPLVELCGGEHTAPKMLDRAAAIFRSIGMHPLVVRKEVDGFIANRLGDAISRESLWLVHDDVATLQEIDDAVRYSWGLRRAVMGAYRMADGGEGMRQTIEQWAFKWPWSRLTEKPNMDQAFLDRVTEQADALVKADPLDIPTVQKRDDLLVAVLHGLRSQAYGPGETLARWEQGLRKRVPGPQLRDGSAPLLTLEIAVHSDWIDLNGHVAESRYLQLCSDATGTLTSYIGIDAEYRVRSGAYYTLETHLCHLGELHAGDLVKVSTQVLGVDDKRLHLFHVITQEGRERPVATGEQMLIHVDAATKRSGPVKGDVRERLRGLARAHEQLPRPERASASIRSPQSAAG
ncbi:3-hydroxyacyl-CoA dehydrogenase NAD-binding domain-containing protein [Bradyrhizobium cajani]|uniref:Carnitine 3-dehydrogenase n=1 Tax=Bradyrhizobium cajani TaxID=1928661 RepID=A0A844TN82_9BRAD|nr:3-hydroxyacyl-CoA dehydrogenase NAD-binding domain-containing protein [Bradyrhizobium cajani]MCP3371778.1 3-hydroxyacyl-CoA dehydrogenase NAD-binding domain-containing protein [Bradyrhizobium cajani]MVT76401.1 carnitine 3-dehydrogenase [Bradyrhizobium cajani]